MTDTPLSTGEEVVNKTDKNPCCHGAEIVVRRSI